MKETIDKILKQNNINETWEELTTNGLANKIYATQNYILRIPTNHEEAINDALTESIAAPLARMHGIRTPELVKFDNTHTLINSSYSLWERVQGISLDTIDDELSLENVWIEVGIELGKLHISVEKCDDPNGWLDSPDREYSKDQMLEYVKSNYYVDSEKIVKTINALHTRESFSYKKRFVHGDIHNGNVMCNDENEYLALIDWGDSGWADPVIDFYMIPPEKLHWVLKGYKKSAGNTIDQGFCNRIILDKMWVYMEEKRSATELLGMINTIQNHIYGES